MSAARTTSVCMRGTISCDYSAHFVDLRFASTGLLFLAVVRPAAGFARAGAGANVTKKHACRIPGVAHA
eukprot:6192236-Pleurochrysis_carterae.AAC.3